MSHPVIIDVVRLASGMGQAGPAACPARTARRRSSSPRGGAIALGYAVGSSTTRLLNTPVNQLEATGDRFGVRTICEANGMANATTIEKL